MGGQERVALDLAGAQVRRGHEVSAVSLAPLPHGVLAGEFQARGIALHSVPKGASFDLRTVARLARWLRSSRIDVVHTHNPQPLAYGAPAGRLARAVVVHTKHGVNPERGRKLWLRRVGGHLADAYVAVSDATAEVARRNRECLPGRLQVIPNGVDLEAYRPDEAARRDVRAELGIPADAWLLGTVGRVSVEKDHALLVRAAGPLLGPRVRLVIVGDGTELANVQAEARKYDPWVTLTGVRHDIARVLASFDAFVLSSRSEGLPLALLEAMADRVAGRLDHRRRRLRGGRPRTCRPSRSAGRRGRPGPLDRSAHGEPDRHRGPRPARPRAGAPLRRRRRGRSLHGALRRPPGLTCRGSRRRCMVRWRR